MHLCGIAQFSDKFDTVIETIMKSFIPVIVLLGLCAGAYCEQVSYENHRVYSIRSENEEQLKLLRAIEDQSEDLIFLTSPSTHIPTDIVVSPEQSEYFDEILAKYGLDFEIKTENLQTLVL